MTGVNLIVVDKLCSVWEVNSNYRWMPKVLDQDCSTMSQILPFICPQLPWQSIFLASKQKFRATQPWWHIRAVADITCVKLMLTKIFYLVQPQALLASSCVALPCAEYGCCHSEVFSKVFQSYFLLWTSQFGPSFANALCTVNFGWLSSSGISCFHCANNLSALFLTELLSSSLSATGSDKLCCITWSTHIEPSENENFD